MERFFLLIFVVFAGCSHVAESSNSTPIATDDNSSHASPLSTIAASPTTSTETKTPTNTASPTVQVSKSNWDVSEFRASISVFEGETDEESVQRLRQALLHFHSLGANTLIYVYHLVQDGFQANCVYPESKNWKERIELFTLEAKKLGFDVGFRPLLSEFLLEQDEGKWRGNIKPEDVEAWFECYENHILELARLSENIEGEILVIGSEFSSLESQNLRWAELIQETRNIFTGEITYATNWDVFVSPEHPFRKEILVDNETTTVEEMLDYPGLDFYFHNKGIESLTYDNLVASWESWFDPLVRSGYDLSQVMIVEFGIPPRQGAWIEPNWNRHTKPIDTEEQKFYYCTFFETYQNQFKGVWIWLYTSYLPESDDYREPFSPYNYPAEEVVREYFNQGTLSQCN